jgi:peptidase E
MKVIIAGGGKLHLDARKLIDKAIELCEKEAPNVLLIPTPVTNPPDTDELLGLWQHFGPQPGETNRFATLTYNSQEWPKLSRASGLIDWADVAIILGGNTTELMRRLKVTKILPLLVEKIKTGKLIAVGASAGLGLLVATSITDTYLLGGKVEEKYHPINGSGVVDGLVCAHYGANHSKSKEPRAGALFEVIESAPIGTVGIGVPGDAALIIDDDSVSFHTGPSEEPVTRLEKVGDDDINVEEFPGSAGAVDLRDFFGESGYLATGSAQPTEE